MMQPLTSFRLCALASLALAAAHSFSGAASAAPINYVATGVVDFVDASLAGNFDVGDIFTMTYTIESTTAPRLGSTSTFAAFESFLSQSFTLDADCGSATGPEEIQVDNDPTLPDVIRYSLGPGAGGVVTGAPLAGLNLSTFYFVLRESMNSVFSDALIVPTSLSLGSSTSADFAAGFMNDNDGVLAVKGRLTSLVPESGSLFSCLAALGGLSLAFIRYRI